jgi:hypothetical protein
MSRPSPEGDTIVFFPGTADITEVAEPEIDRYEVILRQDILLDRWQVLGKEIKRLVTRDLPRDIHFELCELLREARI